MRKIKSIPFIEGAMDLAKMVKAKVDLVYFIEQISIWHEEQGYVKFMPYDFQKSYLNVLTKFKNVITLKPRQMGITVITCAYVLWFAMFNPGKTVVIVSLKQTVAVGILRRIRNMYKSLPSYLKCRISNGQDTIGTNMALSFDNDSTIVALAATPDVGRSLTASIFMLDEIAIIPIAGLMWESIQPTLSTGGRSILISTPFGTGNFFHEQYTKAMQGLLPDTKAVKLLWNMHPDRDQAWYAKESAKLGKRRTAQEIDCEFIGSGFNVFDMNRIGILQALYEAKKSMGAMADGGIDYHEKGKLLQFYPPVKGETYYMGCDIATGRSRDYSAFSIMDSKGREVACYKEKIDTTRFAKLIMKWGREYNYAFLGVELNGIGEAIILACQEAEYPNMWTMEVPKAVNDYNFEMTTVVGYSTTHANRKKIIDTLDNDLTRSTEVEVYNPYVFAESGAFIYDPSGRPVALGKLTKRGTNDDLVMAEELGNVSYVDDAIFSIAIANDMRRTGRRHHVDDGFVGIR